MSGSAVVNALASPPWWIPWDGGRAPCPRASLLYQKQDTLAVPTTCPENLQTWSEGT